MNTEETTLEILKCKSNPWYFATKYMTVEVNGVKVPFTTRLSEDEYNREFEKMKGNGFNTTVSE